MLSATLSSTAASAGLIALRPRSKQKSRGTSIVTAPSLRWPMTTGVFSNHDASHLRSTASAAANSVFCSAALGATGGGDAADGQTERRRRDAGAAGERERDDHRDKRSHRKVVTKMRPSTGWCRLSESNGSV